MLLVFTSETRESLSNWTIPALNGILQPLGRYIHLKVFQELPPPQRKGTIEDFEALALGINGIFV